MDPPVVYYLIFTIFFSFLRPINRDYSQLPFDYIAYSANNTVKRCVFVIYQHKGKCNSLISILLLFCLSRRKHIQYIIRWLFIIFLHFVKSFVWYRSVFNQYSCYCDLFCLGTALRICHRHRHVLVWYFDTTKIMVLCIS